MNNIITSTADFNGQEITVIHKDGERWLTAEQIGLALGLRHPNRAVNKLFTKYRNEFRPGVDFDEVDMGKEIGTELVPISRGPNKIRVFSPHGCMLLGFLARTPRAAEFRVWARDVLVNHGLRYDEVVRELLAARPLWRRILALKDMMNHAGEQLTNAQIAAALGIHKGTLRKHLRRMESFGILPPPPGYERYRAMASHMHALCPSSRVH